MPDLCTPITITLRSDLGISPGFVRRLEKEAFIFDSDGDIAPSDETIEFRIDLPRVRAIPGSEVNVFGRCRVYRASLRADGGQRFYATIREMASRDRNLLGDYVDTLRLGRAWDPEDLRSAPKSSPSRAAQIESNLRQFDRLHPETSAPSLSNPWGLHTSSSASRRDTGREAIRAALHMVTSKVGTAPPASPPPRFGTPALLPTRDPPSSAKRHSDPPSLRTSVHPRTRDPIPLDPPRPSPNAGTRVNLALSARTPTVDIEYLDPSVFQTDFQQYLRNRALFIPCLGPRPTRGQNVAVRITLPSGMPVATEGRIEVVMSNGFGVSLPPADASENDEYYKVLSTEYRLLE